MNFFVVYAAQLKQSKKEKITLLPSGSIVYSSITGIPENNYLKLLESLVCLYHPVCNIQVAQPEELSTLSMRRISRWSHHPNL